MEQGAGILVVFSMATLFHNVDDSQLASLKERLEEMSLFSRDFFVLLSGATVIASLGLFQNSPAVIIGAMIIAPLMRPLVALSLATLTGDTKLLGRSVSTIAIGTLTGLLIALTMAMFFHSLELTDEIFGRTHPTLLDLGVAVFAGAVGAYCQASKKLNDTLAGVAISVALVPPLSVVGIGLAYHNQAVWTGAALLYATNLIGITISGAIVFLLLGYTPLHQAKKGLLISGLVSCFLVIPLGLSMRELILENQISASIKHILKEKTYTFKDVQLHTVKVERFKSPMTVRATVVAPDQPITRKQVAMVQGLLTRELNLPLNFKLQIIPSIQITAADDSDPLATDAGG